MSTSPDIALEPHWKEALQEELSSPYFQSLREFLLQEKRAQPIYPPGSQIFAAFDLTPLPEVKVVILGQDPYHGPGQANGLAFSVNPGLAFPPSLRNIFQELRDDLGHPLPSSGSLEPWARQGVLLLNATLTVRHRSPASHQKQGWEQFTSAALRKLAEERDHLVFLLWGRSAQQKKEFLDPQRHCILESPHPSPFSASRGFFGSQPFSRANAYLQQQGKEPIDWKL